MFMAMTMFNVEFIVLLVKQLGSVTNRSMKITEGIRFNQGTRRQRVKYIISTLLITFILSAVYHGSFDEEKRLWRVVSCPRSARQCHSVMNMAAAATML